MRVFTFITDKTSLLHQTVPSLEVVGSYEEMQEKLKRYRSNEIICFLNNPNVIFLEELNNLENENNLLVAKASYTTSVLDNYIIQKQFPSHRGTTINTSLIAAKNDVFKTFLTKYISSQHNTLGSYLLTLDDFDIDHDNKVFYDYDGSNKDIRSSFVCTTTGKDISVFKKNYTSNDVKKELHLYWKEFILVIMSVIYLIYLPKRTLVNLVPLILLWYMFFEYELYVKKQNRSWIRKALFMLLDTVHNILSVFIVYVIICVVIVIVTQNKVPLRNLLFLNAFELICFVMFVYYKRCIVTLLSNKVLDIKNENIYLTIFDKPIRAFFGGYDNRIYMDASERWLKANQYKMILICIINCYVILNKSVQIV